MECIVFCFFVFFFLQEVQCLIGDLGLVSILNEISESHSIVHVFLKLSFDFLKLIFLRRVV